MSGGGSCTGVCPRVLLVTGAASHAPRRSSPFFEEESPKLYIHGASAPLFSSSSFLGGERGGAGD